tara:strand:- start:132 stop:494 length:363 start_codon:yes stop_codon:yes gene_type:complete
MQQILYANNEHKVIIENYIIMLKEFVKDVANTQRYKNYTEVYDIIVEYHNNYGNNTNSNSNNWYDWLMILPINLSVMTNGFFAGIETKKNQASIRAYKILLNEMLQDVINKLENLDITNE